MSTRFQMTSRLPAEPNAAYSWHARPGAFERLVPPWQSIRVLERSGQGIEEGVQITLRLARGPFRMNWQAEHGPAEPGRRFEDFQISGPFKSWRHVHEFLPGGSPDEASCVLSDTIDYELPGGGAGDLLVGPVVEKDLERVFSYRHRTTREDLQFHRRFGDRPRLRVAISGSSGLLGSALQAFLTTGGHEVLRLVRSDDEELPKDAARWDPALGLIDLDRAEGLDAVVHLAGENIADGRWTPRRKSIIADSRIRGTEQLVASLARLEEPPKSFLSASAIGFYGDRGNHQLDEESAAGSGFLAEVCSAWERRALEAADFGSRVALLRFGVILSPGGGALEKMLPPFKMGVGGTLGSGRQYVSWVSIDDAVSAILEVIYSNGLEGAINITAPRPVTNLELTRTLGRVLNRPAVAPMPALAARALFGEMADEMLLASTRVLPGRLAAVGFPFRHPTLEVALDHLLGRSSTAVPSNG
jgi:uncharacterized protein (TIGR01777 family)